MRDHLLVFGPALVLAAVAFAVAITFVEPAPPRRIVLATGRPDGAYHQFGLRYQAELAREGITVELRPTSGSVENLRLLADPASGVSVAFVQGGVRVAAPAADLVALGSLYFEPLWVFARGGTLGTDVSNLRGRRIAVGPEGSGTRALVDLLLRVNGIGTDTARLSAAHRAGRGPVPEGGRGGRGGPGSGRGLPGGARGGRHARR